MKNKTWQSQTGAITCFSLYSGDGRDHKPVVRRTYKALLAHGPKGADYSTTQRRKRTAANVNLKTRGALNIIENRAAKPGFIYRRHLQ